MIVAFECLFACVRSLHLLNQLRSKGIVNQTLCSTEGVKENTQRLNTI